MKKIVVFGEALIDFVPIENGTALKDVDGFYRRAGGAPANVAACIGKLGGQVTFVGQVGNDAFGHHIKEMLEQFHVYTNHLNLSPNYPTALAFVTLRADGERDFIFVRQQSADIMMHIKDIPLEEVFNQGFLFHLGSNLFMDKNAYTVSKILVERAKAQGLLVSYDPNLRPLLWPNQKIDKDKVLSILNQVDILKVSEEELFTLTEITPDAAHISEGARKLISMGPSMILVTIGDQGCLLFRRGLPDVEPVHVTGYSVKAVDTTGAGDAFIGAFLYRLSTKSVGIEKLSIEELVEDLRFANAVGALTTTKPGAMEGLPSMEEISALR